MQRLAAEGQEGKTLKIIICLSKRTFADFA